MSGKPAKNRIENGTTRFAQTISIFNPTQVPRSLIFSKDPSEVTASGIPFPPKDIRKLSPADFYAVLTGQFPVRHTHGSRKKKPEGYYLRFQTLNSKLKMNSNSKTSMYQSLSHAQDTLLSDCCSYHSNFLKV